MAPHWWPLRTYNEGRDEWRRAGPAERQGSEVKRWGGPNPKTETTLWGGGEGRGQSLISGERRGAYLDCGGCAAAPRSGRWPGQRCSVGSPGHSAPAPGSYAAGTAPCRWRDKTPRRKGRPLALPDTHSAQHQQPAAAQCPSPALTGTAPPAVPKPSLACITHLLVRRLLCSLCFNPPRPAGPLGVG